MIENKTIIISIAVILFILIILSNTFLSSNTSNTKENEDKKEIRENFPSPAINVLYSDVNGNLSSTTDLGVNDLNVINRISSGGSISTTGALSAGSISTTGSLSAGTTSVGNLSTSGTLTASGGRTTLQNVVIGDANLSGPDGKTWISREGILFGGKDGSNASGRHSDSAQITAGKHEADTLCIMGMSNANATNRKITMWADGGCKINGKLSVNSRDILDELDALKTRIAALEGNNAHSRLTSLENLKADTVYKSKIVNSCSGYNCSGDKICLPGTTGAGSNLWECNSTTWIQKT